MTTLFIPNVANLFIGEPKFTIADDGSVMTRDIIIAEKDGKETMIKMTTPINDLNTVDVRATAFASEIIDPVDTPEETPDV